MNFGLRRAERYLLSALLITFSALIALAICVSYRERMYREKEASLLAAEILAVQNSKNREDGTYPIHKALMEVHLRAIVDEEMCKKLIPLADTAEFQSLGEAIGTAYRENRFSASFLHAEFQKMLKNADIPGIKTENRVRDAVTAEGVNWGDPWRETDAVREAVRYFGISLPFQSAETVMGKCVYCRNIYMLYGARPNELRCLSVACAPGEQKLTEEECASKAESYMRDVLKIQGTERKSTVLRDGVLYLNMENDRNTVLLGIRADTGSVCFLLNGEKSAE